jgi:hypothetical protein
MDRERIPLTLIYCAFGGRDEERRTASLKALWEMDALQDKLPSQAMLLELVCGAEVPMLEPEDIPGWIKYERIEGTSANRNMFHKEGLWNAGIAKALNDSILCMDIDTYPTRKDYLQRVLATIQKGTLVHPMAAVIYPGNNAAMLSVTREGVPPVRMDVPITYDKWTGSALALHKADMDGVGLPSQCITRGGDFITFAERTSYMDSTVSDLASRMKMVRPDLPQLELVGMPDVLVHAYHGPFENRGHRFNHDVLMLLGHPDSYTSVDKNGVRAWNDPECWFADVLVVHADPGDVQKTMDRVWQSARNKLVESAMKSADIQRSGSLHYDKETGHKITKPEITEGINENLVPEIVEDKPKEQEEKPTEEPEKKQEEPSNGEKTP